MVQITLRPYVPHDQDGINSLPNEVLTLVFELVCVLVKGDIDPYAPGPSLSQYKSNFVAAHVPIRLSHINRRFRRVALDCPTLWTSVSCAYDIKLLRLFLERSGRNTGLTILLGPDPDLQWQQLYSLAPRWKNVVFYRKSLTYSNTRLEDTWPFNELLELPGLDSLSFTFPKNHTMSLDYDVRLPWDAPNLRLFTAINSVPYLPVDGGTNILSLNLAIHFSPFMPLSHLISTKLRQLPNLVELSLSLNCHKRMFGDTENDGAYDTVELRHLASLTVELRRNYAIAILISSIIKAPNVRKMNVVLHPRGHYSDFDLNKCNEALFLNSMERFPMLQEIGYVVTSGYSGPRGRSNDILQFLTKRQNLEHVSLKNPHGFLDVLEGQFPIVRTLTLNCCHSSLNQYLEKILKRSSDAYTESNGTRGLKRLQITECPNIDMEKIRKLVPAGRINVFL